MTEPTDIDALIAEARNRGDALRTLFPNDGDIRDDARLYETLADALESTLAMLRQERERADDLKILAAGRVEAWRLTEANKALSRAEETIEAVKVARSNHPECPVVPAGISCGWKRAVQDIDAAITEYDKQNAVNHD